MNANKTLVDLFNSQKQELIDQLTDLALPEDCEKVKKTVSDYLDSLFNKDGEFRMALTQSEDYILSAALSLLNAQQEIANALISSQSSKKSDVVRRSGIPFDEVQGAKNPFKKVEVNPATTLLGAGGGATLGHIICGGWGSLFGSIAGTAVAIYLSSMVETREKSPIPPNSRRNDFVQDDKKAKLDVQHFISITRKICESVDNLIATFRAQVQRVVDKYENQDKPSLEREYSPLLECIQSVVGYERAHIYDEKYAKKISERIEDLAECVENYNLNIVDFSEENKRYFVMVQSANATEIKQAYPAIIKNSSVVLRGKVFIPETIE